MGLFSKAIDKRIGSYQQELVETHYREVDNMYRQIRGWRHDYRNHIQTMKAYAAAGDWEAICQYLDLLDEDLTTVDTVIKTGNPMTDASLPLPEEQRMIRVYMDTKGTQLYISFTNLTAGKKLKKQAGRFRSTKGEGHGFGLLRMDTIVERLGGYLSRNSEDGAFTTEILLPLETPCNSSLK